MTRRSTAATLRRYRAEWKAALSRRDFVKTRTILGAALSAISAEAHQDLESETQALHGLLALERRVQAIVDGEAPPRLPPAEEAFALSCTSEFKASWLAAIDEADYGRASRVVARAIAALSRRLLKRARSQQATITRLKRLGRTPLAFKPVPSRCAFCGGTSQPGVDSGRLFICQDCVRLAFAILGEQAEGKVKG